jgi:ATP-dependent Clp protease ATP-binding subunit ClpA/CHAT domain-containing protein
MSAVPTLNVDLYNRNIRYRLTIPERDGGGPLEEQFSRSYNQGVLLALQKEADNLLRSPESEDFPQKAKSKGSVLYRTFIPQRLGERLKTLSGPLLISTSFYGLPWEMFHDGKEFWGLRYALGRQIVTERMVPVRVIDAQRSTEARALIIGSNPKGDLYFVGEEVEKIYGTLDTSGIRVDSDNDSTATLANVTEHLQEGFDFIHYSGHVVVGSQESSSLLLAEEILLPAEVIKHNLVGTPLVFLNGCASVRGGQAEATDEWERYLYGVADGFLFGGATAVVGTLCDVTDAQAANLAEKFYEHVLNSAPLGEALRAARDSCRTANPNSPAWLSFVLYGNPSQVVFTKKPELKTEPPPKPEPTPVQSLFTPDGALAPTAWRAGAVKVLVNARAEALGHSADSVCPVDILIALVATPLFRSALVSLNKEASSAPPVLIKFLRARTKSGGRGPLPSTPNRRHHFDRDTLAIVEVASAAAGAQPIGVRELILSILSGTVTAIDGLLTEVGLERVRLRHAVDATEDQPSVLQSDTPTPASTTSHVPTQVSEAETHRTSTTSQTRSLELFDAFGQLRDRAVSPPVFEVLMNAAGEMTAVGDTAIEPLHIFIALLCSPHVQRELRVPARDRTIRGRFARSAIYSLFGKKPSQSLHPTLPERRFFSSDALEILQRAASSSAEPLRWEVLLAEIDRLLGPKLKTLAAGGEPMFNRLVEEFIRESGRSSTSGESGASAEQGGGASTEPIMAEASPDPPRASTPLRLFGRDLTEEAQAGRIAPLIGRQEELQQIGIALARKDKSNVLLIGEAGVGKTAIVEGLARSIAEGSAPPHLQRRRIIEIDTGRLVAGTRLQGDLEARVQSLLAEVEAHPDIILFIDEFHSFINVGGQGERTALTVGNQLKAALARGQISVIGATTEQEFSLSVEKDPALLRRFRVIRVLEPSPEETLEILRRIKAHLEEQYHVIVADEALVTAVTLADRHLPGHMPDKARDLVVDACATHLIEGDADRQVVVSAEDIRLLASKLTKIPVETLSALGSEASLSLEAALTRHVVGQGDAIGRIAARLRTARIVRDPRRPIAVLLFAGPSGVGKTEMARAIAGEYCGDPGALTTIPMNEYGEKLTISRLVGVGPGWVGYEEEPVLVGALKKRARSVILFDEIEKAHPDVWKILLRLFEEGVLVDSRSKREVNGREAIYIMTSNLTLSETGTVGFAMAKDAPAVDPREILLRSFPEEFVNRIDDTIVFASLEIDAIKKIAAMRLSELTAWVEQEHKVEVQFDDAVAEWVANKSHKPEFGAREVARFIYTEVRVPLGLALLENLRGVPAIRGMMVEGAVRFEATVSTQKPSSGRRSDKGQE